MSQEEYYLVHNESLIKPHSKYMLALCVRNESEKVISSLTFYTI